MKNNERNFKHGFANHGNVHPLYSLWLGIKKRCYYKKRKGYENYGGRGIVVCDEWKDNPRAFISWCLVNNWKPGLLIDREENNGNYEPSNCRFITSQLSVINRRKFKNNKSGYTGIMLCKDRIKYRSRVNGKSLGYFNTKKEAIEVRNNYILKNNLPHKIQKFIECEK